MKKPPLLLIALTALFFTSLPLWAQSQSDEPQGEAQGEAQGAGHYVIEQRYVQQIFWTGDEYTRKYEVVIERIESGTNSVVLREFTENATLQISLPPGNYRYRIIPYDYLDQIGEPSKWVTLEIKPPHVVTDEVSSDKDGNFSFFASLAWSPIIPLHGKMKDVFGSSFYGGGAFLRLGGFYNKANWWFIPGAEISATWYALKNYEGSNEIDIQAGTTGINFVAQKQLPNRMAVNARAGFALGFQTGEVSASQYKYSIGGVIPQLNIEASFLWYAWKELFLEGGLSYVVFMSKAYGSGYLRPWVGAGWKF